MSPQKHPSGRPVRKIEVKGRSIWRVPDEGPVTPRLRDDRKPRDQIGFHRWVNFDDPEE